MRFTRIASTVRTLLHASTLLLLMFAIDAFAQAPSYVAVDLGALRGGSARIHSINAAGQAVGGSGHVYGADVHAFIAGRSTKIRDLGVLPGGDYSEAFSINNAGQVVGTSNTSDNAHAFLWTSAAGLHDLGTLPGATSSQAYGINGNGVIVGASGTQAVRWSNGSIQALPSIAGSDWSEAHAINTSGQIVGFSNNSSDGQRAVLWSNGAIQTLGALPGDTASRANFINDTGMVVGASEGSGGVRAFVWTANAGIQSLGPLGGGNYSEAFGLNNAGQIVGQAGSSLGTHAFLWTASSGMVDLNDVVTGPANLVLTGAFAINDQGFIVAFGQIEPGNNPHQEMQGDVHVHHAGTRAFLLVPH
jgi:probable HAF family extracellular repeat protein